MMPAPTNSEGSPVKSKPANGGRTSIANRDKPLFTSRRRPQHQQEFTTESLNTTGIPTPSPAKSENRSPTRSKPRNARGHNKGFSAALKAIEERKDGSQKNARNNIASKPNHKNIQHPSRRAFEASPSPSPRVLPSLNATRTPSSPRGRGLEHLVSPTSDASSPPRGLAEAYQRIEDEEDLAAQEGSDRELEDIEESVISQDINEQYLRAQHSPSYSARRSTLKEPSMAGVQYSPSHAAAAADDNTRNSGLSNLSEDLVEERKPENASPSRKEQDQQRVDAFLGASAQPFRKAKRRSGFTVEGLRRDDASSQSGSSSFGSSATGSMLSEPALNIPQGWGRKGRHNRTWLKRMNGEKKGEKLEADSEQALVQGTSQEDEQKMKAIEDWQAEAASTPLPPLGASDSLQSIPPPELQPGSHIEVIEEPCIQSVSSQDRMRQWGQDGSDILRYRPSIDKAKARTRNSTADMLRANEIQKLNKSALTTNRLGELKEKRSLERVGRRSASISAETPSHELDDGIPTVKEDTSADKAAELERARSDTLAKQRQANHDEGVPIPDSPVVVFSSKSTTPTGEDSSKDMKMEFARPHAKRNDSRDLLRKLARVASPDSATGSGSPIVATNKASDSEVVTSSDTELRKQESQESIEEPPGERGEEEEGVESTPQNTKVETYLKTPLVTGAWIDTPAPVGDRHRRPESPHLSTHGSQDPNPESLKSSSTADVSLPAAERNQYRPTLEDTAPKLPKSALTAIINRAREKKKAGAESSNDDTLQLDESTIESLEELLASSEGEMPSSSPPTPPEPSPQVKSRKPRKKSPMLRSPKLQRQGDSEMDSEDYNLLTSRLSHLQSSIFDARQGLGTLEKRLRKSTRGDKDRGPSRSASQSGFESECNEAGEFHDFIWPCEKCGRASRSSAYDYEEGSIFEWQWRPVQVLIPRLWSWPDDGMIPRLTRLGLWAALVLVPVMAELVLS